MGIPLVRGRGFTAEDGAGAEPVTIVSKPLADRLAPGGDVIGKTLMFGAEREDAAGAHDRRRHRRFPHGADEHRRASSCCCRWPSIRA